MKVITDIFKVTIGVVVGILIVAAGAVGAGYYFIYQRLSESPEKPIYPEDKNRISEQKSEKDDSLLGKYKARVTWPQGLRLRVEPTIDSKAVGVIPYNEEVIVVEETEDGDWQRIIVVRLDEKAWVKGGNLERIEEE